MQKLKSLFVLSFVLFAALGARAQSSAGANDAELNGNYVLTFNGFSGRGNGLTVFAAVGNFTADGVGNVTNGILDSNGVSSGSVFVAQPFTGSYTIGSDNRGTLTLNIAGGTETFAFAMMASGNAEFIQFDASGGTGTIGSGTIEKADSTAFSIARITGDYAFGLAGMDASSGRIAFAGRLTSDGAGNLSNEAGDINERGTFGSVTFASATYTVTDAAHGRGTTSWTFVFGGTSFTLNFVFYIVNSGKLFVMETDALTGAFPLLTGPVLQQQTPPGGFSNSSLNGGMVLSLTGGTACTSGAAVAPDVLTGLLNADGGGSFTLSFDENCGGTESSFTGLSGTDTVESNGRVAITIGALPEIAYMIGTNEVFFLGSNASVLFGPGDAQAAGTFSNGSLLGNYAGFATVPATPSVTIFSGEFNADGAGPTGNLTGTEDIGNASGPTSGAAFAATYSISSAPTNGRGSVTITFPSGETAVAYVISPTKFVVVPSSDANPSVWLFQQAPSVSPPPTPTSLTLNPPTVVGGQSSTATVTLSGPAPSGGAQITLSSTSKAVAQVPSSVTVPAAQSSASFTVTTSAVTVSTSVGIAAAFGGETQTALLTVTTSQSQTSLTLDPTTVVGGQESSFGTVTLSSPAPSGGAQVTLASSNAAVARVPSNVTVQAGQSSAYFTVATSAVTASTSVGISATFGGATQTASLTVTPPPPPTPTSLTLNPATVVGGQSSTATVTLSGPAPSGGAQITLSSSSKAVAQVPSSVTVPAGQSSASFTVTTSAVSATTSVGIAATFGGGTETALLTLTPPTATLTSLTLNPATVVGGQSSTGTATLSGPAPSGGTQITLSSSSKAVAQVPSSVTVPAGQSSASFPVTTSAVTASTSVGIAATFGGATQTASLTVTPPPLPTPASLTLNPATVVGGQSSTATVTLSGPAPSGGAQITLSSNNTAVAQVPSSVIVPAGQSSASFPVTTSAVTASTSVGIAATFGGATQTASLTVTPPPLPTPTSLTLNPSTVTGGPLVGTSTGTVTLSGPAPSGGAQITLSSSNPGVASVPSSVTIAAGSTSWTFTVNTSVVLSSTNVTISASYNGAAKQASLTVNPVLPPPPLGLP